MIILAGTSHKLSLVTSSSADIEVHESHVDLDGSTATPGADNVQIATSPGPTDIVAAPAGTAKRGVHSLILRNKHAATSNDVTVKHTDGTQNVELIKATLLAGETLSYEKGSGWQHFDSAGKPYAQAAVAATQAEMEAVTSNTATVTPSNFKWHPGACKAWVLAGTTGNISSSLNVSSVGDTAVGAATINLTTAFTGSAAYCCVACIELSSTLVAQSCTYDSRAAGSVILRSVVEAGSNTDPATWSAAFFGDFV